MSMPELRMRARCLCVHVLHREQCAMARHLPLSPPPFPRHTESEAGSAAAQADPARRGLIARGLSLCISAVLARVELRRRSGRRRARAARLREGARPGGGDFAMGPIRSRPKHVYAVHSVTCMSARCALSGNPGNAQGSVRDWPLHGLCAHLARPSPRDASICSTLTVRVSSSPCRHRTIACHQASLLICVKSGGTIATRVFRAL